MKKSSLVLAAAATAALSGAPAKSQAEPLQEAKAQQAAAIMNVSPNGVTVPLGGDASVGVTRSGVFGTAVTGRGVIGSADSAVGLKADFNGNAQHVTATGAQRFIFGTVPVVASVGVSGAREDAGRALGNTSYNGVKLGGEQGELGLDTKGIGPIKTMGVSAIKGKTKDALLENREEQSTTDRVVDNGTTTDTITDTYGRKITTKYLGSEFTRFLARATMDVGTQGELTVNAGREHNNLLGDKTVWDVRGTAYLGTAGKLSAHTGEMAAGQKQTGVEYTYPLSREFSVQGAYSQTRGLIDEKRGAINLVWTPGAKGRYDRPSRDQALSAKNIVRDNLSNSSSELRNLGSYGKVETTVSAPELKNSTLKSSTLNKPTLTTPLTLSVVGADVIATFASSMQGVTYECRIDGGTETGCNNGHRFIGLANGNHIIEVRPVNSTLHGDWVSSAATVAVNTALQIGTVSCTATSITVGDTTTCGITPVDPQGLSSVTATIDGSPATVTGVGTYSVALTGLAVGSHSLVWSAVGKMPDGSVEATPGTVSQTITVSAAPVTPSAPICTENDTANTINCGSIDPTTLEVSTNGGTSYTAFNAATTYAGIQNVLIRVKAQGINPVSAPTSLNFSEVIPLPTLTASLPSDGGDWGTGSIMNVVISDVTAGATWTVQDITTGGPVVTWNTPTSGPGDGLVNYTVDGYTEGKTLTVLVTVTKGSQSQSYTLTAPHAIW